MQSSAIKFWDVLVYDSQTHWNNTVVVVAAVDNYHRRITGILRTASWVVEYRYIPMSNESVVLKKPISIWHSNQRSSTEGEFLWALSARNYAPLLQDLLNDPVNHNEYLLPAHIKQCKNRTFGFPGKIECTDKIRLPMWIMQDDGKLDVAYVYLSDSDGRFHVSPWFDGTWDRLIKWDNFGLSYVTANRLDPEIERYIHSLYTGSEIPSTFPRKLRWLTWNRLVKNDPLSGIQNYQYVDFWRSVQHWFGSEVFRILWFQEDLLKPSHWHNIANLHPQDVLGALYSNDDFFRNLIDFSKQDSSYQHLNPKKGAYQVNVFLSYLSWRMVEWHFWKIWDELWLDNVFLRVDTPLNAYGVHWFSVNAGWLISKPWEYKSQVGDSIMNHAQSQTLIRDVQDDDYVSVGPFIDHNPLVRIYREYLSWSNRG